MDSGWDDIVPFAHCIVGWKGDGRKAWNVQRFISFALDAEELK